MRLQTIKRRADFQRVRGGRRWSSTSFLMEGKARPLDDAAQGARFGFTITKKIGGAVQRNRIRRRLKHALGSLIGDLADPGFDYVVVARRPALETGFTQLSAELRSALERIHSGPKAIAPGRAVKRTET